MERRGGWNAFFIGRSRSDKGDRQTRHVYILFRSITSLQITGQSGKRGVAVKGSCVC